MIPLFFMELLKRISAAGKNNNNFWMQKRLVSILKKITFTGGAYSAGEVYSAFAFTVNMFFFLLPVFSLFLSFFAYYFCHLT